MIRHDNKHECVIPKSWGYEIWITTKPYVMKKLYINSGESIHLQRHEHKHETWYIASGNGRANINGIDRILEPGDYIVIPPKTIHKIKATSRKGLVIIEASTTELDDIVHIEE